MALLTAAWLLGARAHRACHRNLGDHMSETHKPRGRLRLPYRVHVALAIFTLRPLGAYLRIVFALCAAVAWVRTQIKQSQARMPEDDRDNLWW